MGILAAIVAGAVGAFLLLLAFGIINGLGRMKKEILRLSTDNLALKVSLEKTTKERDDVRNRPFIVQFHDIETLAHMINAALISIKDKPETRHLM